MKQERQSKMKEGKENDEEFVVSYVELLDLELPEEKRKLEDKEMVNLCSGVSRRGYGSYVNSIGVQWQSQEFIFGEVMYKFFFFFFFVCV